MNRDRVNVDASKVSRATFIATSMIRDHLKSAHKLEADFEETNRRLVGLCKCCYYLRQGGIAGQAFTTQPCGICGEPQTYSSTNTDILCAPCASINQLCKHCGADLELSKERKFEAKRAASNSGEK